MVRDDECGPMCCREILWRSLQGFANKPDSTPGVVEFTPGEVEQRDFQSSSPGGERRIDGQWDSGKGIYRGRSG